MEVWMIGLNRPTLNGQVESHIAIISKWCHLTIHVFLFAIMYNFLTYF